MSSLLIQWLQQLLEETGQKIDRVVSTPITGTASLDLTNGILTLLIDYVFIKKFIFSML